MPGPLIQVTIQAEEVIATLAKLPRRVQEAVVAKLQNIMVTVQEDIFKDTPGKYLDPKTLQWGVEKTTPTTVIGYIDATDKVGIYYIFPIKARALRFIAKSGDLVYTQMVRHPYPKSTPVVIQRLIELKPWIEDQLEDAVIDAL